MPRVPGSHSYHAIEEFLFALVVLELQGRMPSVPAVRIALVFIFATVLSHGTELSSNRVD